MSSITNKGEWGFFGPPLPSPRPHFLGFPSGASGKEPTCHCRLDLRDTSWIPGWERFPGEADGNPLQYSWGIPWIEEPGWSQSIGSHRVGHNWSDLAQHGTGLFKTEARTGGELQTEGTVCAKALWWEKSVSLKTWNRSVWREPRDQGGTWWGHEMTLVRQGFQKGPRLYGEGCPTNRLTSGFRNQRLWTGPEDENWS